MIRATLLSLFCAALVAVALPAAVDAQVRIQVRPGATAILPIGGVLRASSNIYLLRNPKVQDELKLDADQKKEIQDAFNGLVKFQREEYSKLRGLQPDERQKKIAEVQKKIQARNREVGKTIREQLKPEQAARLEQISLQMLGLYALQAPDVQKKLKISSEQQKKMTRVQKSTTEKRTRLMADFRNGTVERTKLREKFLEIQKENEKNTLEVLTKEQREQFEKMKGKKFDLGRRAALRAAPGARLKLNAKPIRIKAKAIPIQRNPARNPKPDEKKKGE